jgi:hypothetical protein
MYGPKECEGFGMFGRTARAAFALLAETFDGLRRFSG